MPNRYLTSTLTPQPIRKINPAYTDILHILKQGERLDNLAQKYYNDPTISWVIMCANPEWDHELEIPFGTEVRVPYPLARVFDSWNISNDL